jgi:hypothetical protein
MTRPLYSRGIKPVSTEIKAVLAPEPFGSFMEKKLIVLPGFKPRTVHPAN